MKYYNYKRRNLVSGPHLLGTLFIIVGLFALLSPFIFEKDQSLNRVMIVGSGAIILGFLIITSFGGTVIDFADKKYKEYFSFLGYKFGEWIPLPNIETVKVISNTYVRTNTPNGISPTFSAKETDFKILIYSNAPQPVLEFVYSQQSKAVHLARLLASQYEANLVIDLPECKGI